MLKGFSDDGNSDCIYCHEQARDCMCGENSAELAGYNYERARGGYVRAGRVFATCDELVAHYNALEPGGREQPHFTHIGRFQLKGATSCASSGNRVARFYFNRPTAATSS